jgi:hypothetical protein
VVLLGSTAHPPVSDLDWRALGPGRAEREPYRFVNIGRRR